MPNAKCQMRGVSGKRQRLKAALSGKLQAESGSRVSRWVAQTSATARRVAGRDDETL
jgi:anti-sigma factor RsiW